MKRKTSTGDKIIGGILGLLLVLLILGVAFGSACLMGWLTMLVLAAFGVKATYWACVGAWFLLACLFQMARGGKNA